MQSDAPDLMFRADFQVYARTIDRELQLELGEQSRWGAKIHMIALGNIRAMAGTGAKGKEMISQEHSRKISGLIIDV